MKQTFLMCLAVALLGLVACDKNEEPLTSVTPTAPSDYVGTLQVQFAGQTYDNNDIQVSITKNAGTLDLFFHQVKFVPQMPVTIDLNVSGIAYTEQNGNITFAADSIVPTMGGNPYPTYTASNIAGSIVGDSLNFGLTFGTFPTTYAGKKK